ncbi:Protocadherin Fat 4 [Holothuria leucospilota]|uniref:Protocadherin Fat 4 n=1 Tax=Holothuria leucospilota TaxID=206669 RepID=A0A9Q1BFK1_HOLLE|nr:Protocadherin Fat 4 [Holothuria leucospilota]
MAGKRIFSLAVVLVSFAAVLQASGNRRPYFLDTLHHVELPEEEADYYVGRIIAEDPDGDNLTYGIRDTAPQYLDGNVYSNGKLYLVVDPVSGNVTLQTPVDRELSSSLVATWTVSDGFAVNTTKDIILVADKNDVIPRFQGLKGRLDPVLEDTAVGEIITTFSVSDEDAGDNGLVDVKYVTHDNNCDENHPFDIMTLHEGRNNFAITVAEELDYSVRPQYTLCLVAEDRANGSDSLKSNISKIVIPIQDVQNQPPVFLNLPYRREIYENNQVGSTVIQVTAQDGDRGVRVPNLIELTLDSPYFEIDSDGVITTKTSLDRENLEENPLRLNVIATEVDDTQPSNLTVSEVPVVVTVLDEDDNIPQFSDTFVHVGLFENSREGTRLDLGVTVTDVDEHKNAAFNLELIQPLDAFALVTETGRGSALVDVKVNNSALIDYETRQETNFKIKASSLLGNESTLEVTVSIININDNGPVFSQDDGYQGYFAEDVPSGHTILTVQATDEDIGAKVSYAINPPVKEFEVGESSGVITTAPGAYFNALVQRQYFLLVEASDGERVTQTLVTLQCTDVNDNAPVFQRHVDEIFQTEFHDNIPDHAIIRLTAFDADPTSPNNQFSYFIIAGDSDKKFRINDTSGELFFNGSVDYDIGDMAYLLTISARDHGSPPMEGTTTLNVTILDSNDNSPVFARDLYIFSVREDVPNNYVVGNVTASDDDSGFNGILDYNIVQGGSGIFYIITTNTVGNIRVGGRLDKEKAPENGYILNITVQDRGSPPRSTDCLVNIKVIDVNDEKPVFDPDQVLKYSVSEDAFPGFQVFTIHATDLDSNSKLSYQMENIIAEDEKGRKVERNFSSQFSCDENNGTVSVNEELDREEVETFFLELVVRDFNAETEDQQTDTATVTITIEDVNDNAPVFENITDDLSVVEGSANSTIVTTGIHATDTDRGVNGEVVYSLEKDAGGAFKIERKKGIVRVNNEALIDREKYEMLTIIVRATDRGSPMKFAEKNLTIEIEDINDHTPIFERQSYTGKVFENSASDTFVYKVTALDIDPTFGVVSYNIVGGNNYLWFKMNSTNGVISVADNTIDREIADEVILLVEAVDYGQERDTTEVIIEIGDENDNSPTFTHFEKDVTVPEDILKGALITTVVATDNDKPNSPASSIEYTVTGGNGTDYFGISNGTGEVTTTQDLNYGSTPSNKNRVYDIIVQARDKAYPFHSVQETMTIKVNDAGNNPPVITFPEDNSFLTMPECYDNKTVPVVDATAVDSDAGDDSKIAFRLAEVAGYDWSVFRVDNYTGQIFYEGDPPDWSEHPQFRLILEAYNYLSVSEDFDSVDFTINVLDVDNHDPVFSTEAENETATTEIEIQEKLEVGTKVGIVSATDKDDGNPIYYFIVDGNEDDYFGIGKHTGEIFTTKELDASFINITSYTITIKATENEKYKEDSASGKRRQTLSEVPDYDPTIIVVTINIVDINDNPPYFLQEMYTTGVIYTVDFDVIVTRVSAEDDDPDENNRNMVYSILSQDRLGVDKEIIQENDTAFYIDTKTGDIRTKTSFLWLTGGIYFQLRIKVVDPDKNSSYHSLIRQNF